MWHQAGLAQKPLLVYRNYGQMLQNADISSSLYVYCYFINYQAVEFAGWVFLCTIVVCTINTTQIVSGDTSEERVCVYVVCFFVPGLFSSLYLPRLYSIWLYLLLVYSLQPVSFSIVTILTLRSLAKSNYDSTFRGTLFCNFCY